MHRGWIAHPPSLLQCPVIQSEQQIDPSLVLEEALESFESPGQLVGIDHDQNGEKVGQCCKNKIALEYIL